jgi:hypothetical protein
MEEPMTKGRKSVGEMVSELLTAFLSAGFFENNSKLETRA